MKFASLRNTDSVEPFLAESGEGFFPKAVVAVVPTGNSLTRLNRSLVSEKAFYDDL